MSITITGGFTSTGGGFTLVAAPAGNKAIFGYGTTNAGLAGATSLTNLVSNTGVVATDTAGVGTGRINIAAAGYSLT